MAEKQPGGREREEQNPKDFDNYNNKSGIKYCSNMCFGTSFGYPSH